MTTMTPRQKLVYPAVLLPALVIWSLAVTCDCGGGALEAAGTWASSGQLQQQQQDAGSSADVETGGIDAGTKPGESSRLDAGTYTDAGPQDSGCPGVYTPPPAGGPHWVGWDDSGCTPP
jgi:hypothetical protein